MKKCPYCGKEYPNEATVCELDRESLISADPPAANSSAQRPIAPPPVFSPVPPPIPAKALSPEEARCLCARQTWGDQLSRDLICPKCGDFVKRGTGHITDQKWLPIVGGGAGLLFGILASSLPRSSNATDAIAGGAIVGYKAGFWGAIAGMVIGFICAAVFCPSYHCAKCGALRLADFPDNIRKRERLFRSVGPPVIIVMVFAVTIIYVLMEYKHF